MTTLKQFAALVAEFTLLNEAKRLATLASAAGPRDRGRSGFTPLKPFTPARQPEADKGHDE